jgi:hypothetical protein
MMLPSKQHLYDRSPRKTHSRSTYRLKRTVVRRLALIVGVCCAVQFLKLHVLARQSLEAKYTTTTFSGPAELLFRYDSLLDGEIAANRSALIAAKASWRPLGSGCEGSTFFWNQQVIKTFKPKGSPLRSCLPLELAGDSQSTERQTCSPGIRWPTEIPASLAMGTTHGFLPVCDAFFASSSPEQEAQWHLVTPLMAGGTLQALAKTIARNQTDTDLSIHTLDVRFRPRFNELLAALVMLHSRGLCHDDLKLDNIFVDEPITEEDGSWLLGDLGNVRETSHPYHTSRIWTHSNKQLPDCRANDALRATKTYLQFLRYAIDSSPSTRSGFDKALLEAKEPWARLLWRSNGAGNNLRTGSVLQWSTGDENPMSLASSDPVAHFGLAVSWTKWLLLPFHGWQSTHERASALALKITASDAWAKILGLTWVLGVPVGRC